MPAEITQITPGRGRAGAAISLLGSGFSPNPGQNTVTVDGIAAVVTLDSEPQVDCTVPVGVSVGPPHVEVVVTNLDDGTSFTWWWWVKPAPAALATAVLPFKQPFRDELALGPLNEDRPNDALYALAKSFERWVAGIELVPRDLVITKGTLATKAATGLRAVAPGAAGQFLTTLPGGAAFTTRAGYTLRWARQIPAPTNTAILMEAGGVDTQATVVATEEVAPVAGVLFSYSVWGSTGSVSNRINLVELLVNGVVVDTRDLTANNGIGIGPNQVRTFPVNVPVAQGDRVEVRLTKGNTTVAVGATALAQVV